MLDQVAGRELAIALGHALVSLDDPQAVEREFHVTGRAAANHSRGRAWDGASPHGNELSWAEGPKSVARPARVTG
jgi:hypothetical protein